MTTRTPPTFHSSWQVLQQRLPEHAGRGAQQGEDERQAEDERQTLGDDLRPRAAVRARWSSSAERPVMKPR